MHKSCKAVSSAERGVYQHLRSTQCWYVMDKNKKTHKQQSQIAAGTSLSWTLGFCSGIAAALERVTRRSQSYHGRQHRGDIYVLKRGRNERELSTCVRVLDLSNLANSALSVASPSAPKLWSTIETTERVCDMWMHSPQTNSELSDH